MEKFIYLDNAATTKPFEEIIEIYKACQQQFFNPSAVYNKAVDVRKKIDNARQSLCTCLGGTNGKIYFTASATEADNLALSCFRPKSNNSMAIFIGEHPAVYNKAKALENLGANIIYLPADNLGRVANVGQYITSQTTFVSIMHVSNETGAINDLELLVKQIRKISPKAIIHADGVQAFGKIPVNLRELGVDLYTISAHKIYGTKGIGALWVKNGINLNPIVWGGGQENSIRSGTENVAGILALEYCANKVCSNLHSNFNKVLQYRQSLVQKLMQYQVQFDVNGDGSPYILNITFPGIRGEVLLHSLENFGIYISTGSACSSKKPDNRTLKAMGKSADQIKATVRISFSAYDDVDIDYVAKTIATLVKDLQIKIKGK